MEQGTHEALVQLGNGIYAKMLAMARGIKQTRPREEQAPPAEARTKTLVSEITYPTLNLDMVNESPATSARLLQALKRVALDQSSRVYLYLVWVSASIMAGAPLPLQAYLYAQMIRVFELTGSAVSARGDFGSLMLFVVALVVAVVYFAIGGLAANFEEVRPLDTCNGRGC